MKVKVGNHFYSDEWNWIDDTAPWGKLVYMHYAGYVELGHLRPIKFVHGKKHYVTHWRPSTDTLPPYIQRLWSIAKVVRRVRPNYNGFMHRMLYWLSHCPLWSPVFRKNKEQA